MGKLEGRWHRMVYQQQILFQNACNVNHKWSDWLVFSGILTHIRPYHNLSTSCAVCCFQQSEVDSDYSRVQLTACCIGTHQSLRV